MRFAPAVLPLGAAVLAAAVAGITNHAAEASARPSIYYEDIARRSGLTIPNAFGGRDRKEYILETTGNGAAIFDYDGDGRNDIFITNGTTLDPPKGVRPPVPQLYHNDGDGHFTDRAAEAGLAQTGWGQSACVGDFDNDGRPDLFVTAYGHNLLYRNAGGGHFDNVTAKAGLPSTGTRWGSGCAFVDYDRDGYLDIFVSNYVNLDLKTTPKPGENAACEWKGLAVMCGPTGLPEAVNALYHNNRDGTFTDVSQQAGILKPGGRYGLGVLVADFDGDGWPDIYVACDMSPSLLYRNLHNGTFEERGIEAGVAYNFDGRLQSGMGIALGDYDGDGRLDILKTNFSGDLPSLYHNDDGRFFSDLSPQAGLAKHELLGWGVAFLDADEDGWPDVMIANGHVYPEVEHAPVGDKYRQPTLLYRNLGNGTFADLTESAGPALRVPRPARGLATGDLDGDGHPEVVIVNMNEPPSLLKNMGAHRNAIAVTLEGTRSNRSGIGALVDVTTGARRQVQQVTSGGSFYSQNALTLYFGVDNAATVDRLHILWPSGAQQEFKQMTANFAYRIVEGDAAPSRTRLKGR